MIATPTIRFRPRKSADPAPSMKPMEPTLPHEITSPKTTKETEK